MSHFKDQSKRKMRLPDLMARKAQGNKLSMVTCYDAAFARIIENSTIDLVLVGDSMGNVILGMENTIAVTMQHMLHHTAAVARALYRPFLVADLPFASYQITPQQAAENAAALLQAGAEAVKMEGGEDITSAVKTCVRMGIPVMGHLGLTPQSIHQIGGHRIQGRDMQQREKMRSDAKKLEEAGIFALVLEMVPADLAEEITRDMSIPTIGIGAGPACDGQVLVIHDLLGFNQSFSPKFLKRYENLEERIGLALSSYDQEVKSGQYPNAEHCFGS